MKRKRIHSIPMGDEGQMGADMPNLIAYMQQTFDGSPDSAFLEFLEDGLGIPRPQSLAILSKEVDTETVVLADDRFHDGENRCVEFNWPE